jgi:hypothetical protein
MVRNGRVNQKKTKQLQEASQTRKIKVASILHHRRHGDWPGPEWLAGYHRVMLEPNALKSSLELGAGV